MQRRIDAVSFVPCIVGLDVWMQHTLLARITTETLNEAFESASHNAV